MATAKFGDDAMAHELMELALTQTQEFYSDTGPTGLEDVRKTLSRYYQNAIRRESRRQYKLCLWGLANNLEVRLPPAASSSESVEAKVDIDAVLDRTAREVRYALLMRFGARARWKDVADELAQSPDSVRIRCQRELKRLRTMLNIGEQKVSSEDSEDVEEVE
jgi:DNA-directed RNA polymerase specialized sigma24 family protein